MSYYLLFAIRDEWSEIALFSSFMRFEVCTLCHETRKTAPGFVRKLKKKSIYKIHWIPFVLHLINTSANNLNERTVRSVIQLSQQLEQNTHSPNSECRSKTKTPKNTNIFGGVQPVERIRRVHTRHTASHCIRNADRLLFVISKIYEIESEHQKCVWKCRPSTLNTILEHRNNEKNDIKII